MILPSLPALDVRRFQSRKERKAEASAIAQVTTDGYLLLKAD